MRYSLRSLLLSLTGVAGFLGALMGAFGSGPQAILGLTSIAAMVALCFAVLILGPFLALYWLICFVWNE